MPFTQSAIFQNKSFIIAFSYNRLLFWSQKEVVHCYVLGCSWFQPKTLGYKSTQDFWHIFNQYCVSLFGFPIGNNCNSAILVFKWKLYLLFPSISGPCECTPWLSGNSFDILLTTLPEIFRGTGLYLKKKKCWIHILLVCVNFWFHVFMCNTCIFFFCQSLIVSSLLLSPKPLVGRLYA